jgi:hypothetical protein
MTKKLFACAAILLSGGCRMCSDCCDYAPVVPGGPPLGTSRSGSVSTGGYAMSQPVATPVVSELEMATPATVAAIETAN